MQVNQCPVCNSTDFYQYYIDERYSFTMQECQNCSLLFKTSNYTTDYESLSIESYNIYNFSRKREVYELVKILKSYRSDYVNLSFLEIGSGSGSLLNEFRNFGILNLSGIEPSKIASDYSIETFKLNVVNAYFNSKIIKKKHDVILLYDVLEHIEKPNKLIKEISTYMSNDTILIIKSGNTNSINARIHPREWQYYKSIQHVCFYNRRSLNKLLVSNNLKIVTFKRFKHAYGGIRLDILLRNILFGLLVRFLSKVKLYVKQNRSYGLSLANDHFIALIKKV